MEGNSTTNILLSGNTTTHFLVFTFLFNVSMENDYESDYDYNYQEVIEDGKNFMVDFPFHAVLWPGKRLDDKLDLHFTTAYPTVYAKPLLGYIYPILPVVTIILNGIVVIVLSRPHMRSTTNLVLLSTAISDTLTMLVPAPWNVYTYTFGNHNSPFYPIAACYAFDMMHFTIPNIFHTASIWLTLLLALQRFVCVKYPLKAKIWVTWSRVVKAIIFIVFVTIVSYLPRFFDRDFTTERVIWEGEIRQVCRQTYSFWVYDILTEKVYLGLYRWYKILFMHLIPCVFLIYFTSALMVSVYKSQKIRSQLLFRDRTNVIENDPQQNFNSTTIMLIMDVSVFLLVEVPFAVLGLNLLSTFGYTFFDPKVHNAIHLFANFFIYLSLPINFFIYYGMSQNFRDTLKALFRCRRINTDKQVPHPLPNIVNKNSNVDTCV